MIRYNINKMNLFFEFLFKTSLFEYDILKIIKNGYTFLIITLFLSNY